MAEPHGNTHPFEEEELEEAQHFQRMVGAYAYYFNYCQSWLRAKEQGFQRIPPEDLALLPQTAQKFKDLNACVKVNYHFICNLIQDDSIFVNKDMKDSVILGKQTVEKANPEDMEKVKSTLRQFARDWSQQGAPERQACYDPFLTELGTRWPNPSERKDIRILSPGSGLGRLPFEIARMGFASQGNEFSYLMLIASNWILNRSQKKGEFIIHPYIHSSSNTLRIADQLGSVAIPDIVPSDELTGNAEFSMGAGDFLDVYGADEGQWDAVCCCFFLDTARNIVQYLRVIHKILKPGGLFLNFGPLLFHFESENESIEVSWEEVKSAAEKIGFVFTEVKTHQKSEYTAGNDAMMKVIYECVWFIAKKK